MLTVGFDINIINYNNIACKLDYYISYLSSIYLPVLLTLASIDRLLISSQNVDTRLYSSKRLAYFTISTSLFICMIFSLHILIKVDVQEIYPTVFFCYYDLSRFYQNFLLYSTVIIGIGPPFVVGIVSFLSFKNVRHIQAVPRENRNRIRAMTKKDFQLLRCLYAYDIVYIFSTVLLVVAILYGVIHPLQQQTATQQALYVFLNNFGSFIHYIPFCAIFFILISISKAFRNELKRLGFKLCCRDLHIVQEENQPHEIVGREIAEMNAGSVSTINLRR